MIKKFSQATCSSLQTPIRDINIFIIFMYEVGMQILMCVASPSRYVLAELNLRFHWWSLDWKRNYTTTNMILSVTYYLNLHGAISFYYWDAFLPSKVVNVL